MGVDLSAGSYNMEHQLLSLRASEDKSSSLSLFLPHVSAVCFHPFSLGMQRREGNKIGQDLCDLVWSRNRQGNVKSMIRFNWHQLNISSEVPRLLCWSREKKPASTEIN